MPSKISFSLKILKNLDNVGIKNVDFRLFYWIYRGANKWYFATFLRHGNTKLLDPFEKTKNTLILKEGTLPLRPNWDTEPVAGSNFFNKKYVLTAIDTKILFLLKYGFYIVQNNITR